MHPPWPTARKRLCRTVSYRTVPYRIVSVLYVALQCCSEGGGQVMPRGCWLGCLGAKGVASG